MMAALDQGRGSGGERNLRAQDYGRLYFALLDEHFKDLLHEEIIELEVSYAFMRRT